MIHSNQKESLSPSPSLLNSCTGTIPHKLGYHLFLRTQPFLLPQVRLEGSRYFSLPSPSVRLEARSSFPFVVSCTAHHTGEHTARLLFLSRGNGLSVANASTLVFSLEANIEMGPPAEVVHVEAKLYSPVQASVHITNPFDSPTNLKLTMSESRPELTLPSMEGGRDKPSADKGEKSAVRAAFNISDDPTRRLPSAFFCSTPSLQLEGRGATTISVQFLPFLLGEHTCVLFLSDETVGEFSYELKGNVLPPVAIDTLSLTCEAASSSSKELILPFRNPLVEKVCLEALATVGALTFPLP